MITQAQIDVLKAFCAERDAPNETSAERDALNEKIEALARPLENVAHAINKAAHRYGDNLDRASVAFSLEEASEALLAIQTWIEGL